MTPTEAGAEDAARQADREPPEEDAPDYSVAPECPATADEHDPDEVTSIPLSPSGRCEVFMVCTACGAQLAHVGSDSVL